VKGNELSIGDIPTPNFLGPQFRTSAIDAISPAFQHSKQQLLSPFRAAQWAKLALVGLLAGEMSSGGCSAPNFHMPARSGGTQHFLSLGLPAANPMLYAGLIAVIVLAALIFFVLFAYVSSVMRFVLFDSVVARECNIAAGWQRRQRPGMRLFVFHILFSLVTLATLVIAVGIPLVFAYAAGWIRHSKEHMIGLVLGGIVLFFVFLACVLASIIIHVLTKDFVVPQMALEDLGPLQGWRRLLPMIESEIGSYAGYLGMKAVLSIGAGIALAIVALIAILIIVIPVGGIGAVAVLLGKAAGLTFNVYTITLLVIVGTILLAIIIFVMAFISVPATVFFPAYSIYFFASRYAPLAERMKPSSTSITFLQSRESSG
jgi:hypothetical protein